jgi:uracil-DNA glycosylase
MQGRSALALASPVHKRCDAEATRKEDTDEKDVTKERAREHPVSSCRNQCRHSDLNVIARFDQRLLVTLGERRARHLIGAAARNRCQAFHPQPCLGRTRDVLRTFAA